jgi:hypothetical protein
VGWRLVGASKICGIDGARDVHQKEVVEKALFLTRKEAACDIFDATVLAGVRAAHDCAGGGVIDG